MSVPLSVLDLAPVAAGSSAAEALAGTTRLAQRADELGFRRFWVAEHHNIPRSRRPRRTDIPSVDDAEGS